MDTNKKTDKSIKGADLYPGVAIDVADDEKTTPQEVKAETCELNNNPRTTDDKMP